jgi:hypothetical protein
MESKTPSSPRLRLQEIESDGKDFIRLILDDSWIDLDVEKVAKVYRFLMLFVKSHSNEPNS